MKGREFKKQGEKNCQVTYKEIAITHQISQQKAHPPEENRVIHLNCEKKINCCTRILHPAKIRNEDKIKYILRKQKDQLSNKCLKASFCLMKTI